MTAYPSLMPIYADVGVATAMSLGSFITYTYYIYDTVDGPNYEYLFYATLLNYVPSMILGWNVVLGIADTASMWPLYHGAFLSAPEVVFSLNWLALFYA